jgi:hypothetical protein
VEIIMTARVAVLFSLLLASAVCVAQDPGQQRTVLNGAIELVNSDFESPADKKGRVPYWNEPAEQGLMPGTRGGTFALDAVQPPQGAASLRLTASKDWFAFCSINYPVGQWTEEVVLSARARTGAHAQVRLGLVWADSAEKTLRVDWGDNVESAAWRKISAGPLRPPANTHQVRAVLAVRSDGGTGNGGKGTVGWFDEIRLSTHDKPYVRVAVNQVGWDARGPKRVVVLSRSFSPQGLSASVELLNAEGRAVAKQPLAEPGRMRGEKGADWGWYVWRADFSSFSEAGQYRCRARIGPTEAISHPFRIEPDLLFTRTAESNVDFFFVQRCGFDVPGWHAACHLDCAKLPGGAHRDLTGGWHSAGDYNKLNWEYGDGGVTYALVNAYESEPKHFARFDRDGDGLCDILDEAWWGAKFLAKVQIPETGGILNHIEQGPNRRTWMKWCPPEQTTDNVVGTPDDPIVTKGEGNSPLAIGAWARLARLLEDRGFKNDYRKRAEQLWKHATADGTGGPNPLLLISSIDLYRVTHQQRVREYARRSAQGLLTTGQRGGQLSGGYGNSGDLPAAALAYFALRFADDELAADVKRRLVEHTPGFLAEADNPLGLMRQKPGKDGYFFDPSSSMGCNYQACCRAWSALMVYRVTRDRRLLEYATDQLDFLLGRNPYDVCMMEGQGSVNLPRYHHRYSTIPGHARGAVPGAIPNGFVRDLAGRDCPGLDLSTGGRPYPSYRTNEPWLVHNVFYTLAVTSLHEAL